MIIKEADNFNKGIIVFEDFGVTDNVTIEEIDSDDLFVYGKDAINKEVDNLNINLESSFVYYTKAKLILEKKIQMKRIQKEL